MENVNLKNLEASVDKIINNSRLIDLLVDLHFRWQDEKQFEDFAEYTSVMKSTLLEIEPNAKFKSGLKRPIGFVSNIEGIDVKVFLKIRGNSANLCVKFIKK